MLCARLIFLALVCAATGLAADSAESLVRDALAAEAKLDSTRALERFLAADRAQPDNPLILQKIARQYSDLEVDAVSPAEKKKLAQHALGYAQRAVVLDPKNPVNVLSLAICHGKLGVHSDTRTKIEYSRLVREEAARALALDPDYAWAHHVLGRWHYEVATLGGTTKFFVRLIYGGLPDASVAEAVKHLSRAEQLDPRTVAHPLELGFALLAAGENETARAAFARGLALPSREKQDETAKARARAALEKLR